MPCPDLGALRASLDAAAGTPAPLHDHVHACASCADTLAELQRNAELAAPAIALTAPDVPPSPAAVQAALTRFEQRRARVAAATPGPVAPAPAAVPDPIPLPRRRRVARLGARARGVAAGLVAALVLAGLLVTPGGRAAAAGFLAQFRSQRFEVVSVDPAQSTQVADVVGGLVKTGVFTGDALQASGLGEPEVVAGLAEASRIAGFAVPAVDPAVLPGGVGHTPERVLVSPAREARITFDRDRALAYLRNHGRPAAQLPERYDGTQLVVRVPAAVVQQFAGRDGGPALLVGKAGNLGSDHRGRGQPGTSSVRSCRLCSGRWPRPSPSSGRSRTGAPPCPAGPHRPGAVAAGHGARRRGAQLRRPDGPAPRPALAAGRAHLGRGRGARPDEAQDVADSLG
jgi:hypothetical protein